MTHIYHTKETSIHTAHSTQILTIQISFKKHKNPVGPPIGMHTIEENSQKSALCSAYTEIILENRLLRISTGSARS